MRLLLRVEKFGSCRKKPKNLGGTLGIRTFLVVSLLLHRVCFLDPDHHHRKSP